jgi:hypothetical protein
VAAAPLECNKLPQGSLGVLAVGTKKILAFLTSYQWALAPESKPGCSWLELLVAFCLRGCSLEDLELNERPQGPRPSLRVVLRAFVRKVKATVKMHLATHSQVFFKASKIPFLRCKAIGYTNHCACITGLPSFTSDQAAEVAKHLIGLRHSFTSNSTKLLADGMLQLMPRKFSYRGSLPDSWRVCNAHFPRVDHTEAEPGLRLESSFSSAPQQDIKSLRLSCPVCKCSKECINQVLIKGTTWRSILCPQPHCRRARTSAKWQCACNKLWYLCHIHGPVGHAAGAANAKLPRQPNSNEPSSSSHGRHQPSAPELVMPVEPGPKRQKVDGRHGVEHKQNGKRRSSTQGPLPKRRRQCNDEAIASIARMRESRTQVLDLGFG